MERRKVSQKNYITPKGFSVLKAEYQKLIQIERPKIVETVAWAASNGDRSENADYIYGKRRLREIDKRLHFLSRRLELAEVIDPKTVQSKKVAFGATVELEDDDGKIVIYQLVGEDESEPEEGMISWKSPIGAALMGKGVEEDVLVKRPAGDIVFTILSIKYS